MPIAKWVSVKDAAATVGVNLQTLYRWLWSARVVGRRIARDGRWVVALAPDGFTIPTTKGAR